MSTIEMIVLLPGCIAALLLGSVAGRGLLITSSYPATGVREYVAKMQRDFLAGLILLALVLSALAIWEL